MARYREYLAEKGKKRKNGASRPARNSEAADQRSQALKRQQGRPKSPYGTPATQGRLLDA